MLLFYSSGLSCMGLSVHVYVCLPQFFFRLYLLLLAYFPFQWKNLSGNNNNIKWFFHLLLLLRVHYNTFPTARIDPDYCFYFSIGFGMFQMGLCVKSE